MIAARTSDVVQQGVLHAIEHHFPKTNPMNYDFPTTSQAWTACSTSSSEGSRAVTPRFRPQQVGNVSMAARRWRPSGALKGSIARTREGVRRSV